MGFDFPKNEKEFEQFAVWFLGDKRESLRPFARLIYEEKPIDSRILHDVWNAYAYGDTVRIVYIKARKAPKLPEPENFFQVEGETRAERKKAAQSEKTANPGATGENGRFAQSLSRSRAKVFELAACNEFRFFCTFTIDEKKHDRFDLSVFRRDFAQFIRDQNRKRSEDQKIKYLAIPEEHKKGGWHVHALLLGIGENDLRPFRLSEKIPERIKRTIRGGSAVYDWAAYRERFGFFTATEIRDHTATAKYCTKYLTKNMAESNRAAGAHLYFASQGLNTRETLVKNSCEPCPVHNFGETWDYENDYVAIWERSVSDLEPEFIEVLAELTF